MHQPPQQRARTMPRPGGRERMTVPVHALSPALPAREPAVELTEPGGLARSLARAVELRNAPRSLLPPGSTGTLAREPIDLEEPAPAGELWLRTPNEPVALEEPAPAGETAVRSKPGRAGLPTQRIGAVGAESTLDVPAYETFDGRWVVTEGADFGGDAEVAAFVAKILARAAARKTVGEKKLRKQLSKTNLAAEFQRMRTKESEHTWGAPQIKYLKYVWLNALRGRLDAATIPGVSEWNMSPTTQKSGPTMVDVPPGLGFEGSSVKPKKTDADKKPKVSKPMADLVAALKPLATGFSFRVVLRPKHSKGYGADFYLSAVGKDAEGFWHADKAAEFLALLKPAAATANVSYHVIYNDPRVTAFLNATEKKHFSYSGSYRHVDHEEEDGSITPGVDKSYHGPDNRPGAGAPSGGYGLTTMMHFHIDAMSKAVSTEKDKAVPAAAKPGRATGAPAAAPAAG